MDNQTKIAIAGINGKMGRFTANLVLAQPELKLVGAFGSPGASYVGRDIGDLVMSPKTGILVSNGFQDILTGQAPDLLLDFTRAEAAVKIAKLALEKGVRPIIGTSGISAEEIVTLKDLAKTKGIGGMVVPNFSLGAVLMIQFAQLAAKWFQNVEIVEMHHTKKIDAPSGTAMYTIAKMAETGNAFNDQNTQERELVAGARGGRANAGVRVHSLRLPGLISHQEVIFGADGELLSIKHDSLNTNCFAKGILMSISAAPHLKELVLGLENLLPSCV